jgi:ABC-2 type transport system permease protein
VTGMAAFARKEVLEILRTWRIWVLPGMMLFFAVTGPFLARFTPQIVGAVAGAQLGGLKLPPPTYHDAYAQWIKNLSQIILFALVIIYGGLISGEGRSGTAILVLTKPVSRAAFVVAKLAVHSVFLAILAVLGTAITWGLTAAMFASAPGSALWAAAMTWLVLGVLFIAVMTLLSVLVRSTAGAAGIGLGAYALLSITTIWKPLATYSPAGLVTQPASLAAGTGGSVAWPIVTALALIAALAALAVLAFRRRDL